MFICSYMKSPTTPVPHTKTAAEVSIFKLKAMSTRELNVTSEKHFLAYLIPCYTISSESFLLGRKCYTCLWCLIKKFVTNAFLKQTNGSLVLRTPIFFTKNVSAVLLSRLVVRHLGTTFYINKEKWVNWKSPVLLHRCYSQPLTTSKLLIKHND